MTVTVLCDLRPRADQVDLVIGRACDQLSIPARGVAGRRFARLCQHVDDPTWLLYLADWTSRAAFETYRQSAPLPGTPDQFEDLPVCRFYLRLALFERALTAATVVYVDVVDGPAETHPTRRDLVLAYQRSAVRRRPGLVLLRVHEALTESPTLLIVTGWETASPGPHDERGLAQSLVHALTTAGGTVQQFVGRTVVETSAT